MSQLYVHYYKLKEYRDELCRQKNEFKTRLEKLTRDFIRLDWSDNVMAATQTVLNAHIQTVNALMSTIDNAVANIDSFLEEIYSYLHSI